MTRDEIHRQFRRSGLRVTPQRVAIYEALVSTTSHPTAEHLVSTVRQSFPSLSANTVYYTLKALRDAGMVLEIHTDHESARFDANMEPHHHVVCRSCRRIIDVQDEALDRLPGQVSLPGRFTITGHRVEIYGYCDSCGLPPVTRQRAMDRATRVGEGSQPSSERTRRR